MDLNPNMTLVMGLAHKTNPPLIQPPFHANGGQLQALPLHPWIWTQDPMDSRRSQTKPKASKTFTNLCNWSLIQPSIGLTCLMALFQSAQRLPLDINRFTQ